MSIPTLPRETAPVQAPPEIRGYFYRSNIKRVVIQGWPADRVTIVPWTDDSNGLSVRKHKRASGAPCVFEKPDEQPVLDRPSLVR